MQQQSRRQWRKGPQRPMTQRTSSPRRRRSTAQANQEVGQWLTSYRVTWLSSSRVGERADAVVCGVCAGANGVGEGGARADKDDESVSPTRSHGRPPLDTMRMPVNGGLTCGPCLVEQDGRRGIGVRRRRLPLRGHAAGRGTGMASDTTTITITTTTGMARGRRAGGITTITTIAETGPTRGTTRPRHPHDHGECHKSPPPFSTCSV